MPGGQVFQRAVLALPAVVALCCGCSLSPKSQQAACETQTKVLAEQNKAQLAEIANLKAQNQKLEGDLQQSARELAALEQRTDADRKRLANFQVERDQVREQVDALARGATLTGIVPARDDDLERLTKSFPLLHFDPASGAYKLDADLAFDPRQTRMTPDSEKLLGELAALLAQPEAGALRVMIVGRGGLPDTASATTDASDAAAVPDSHRLGTDRALAVAAYLRKIGLRGEQIAVSSIGVKSPATSAPAATPAATTGRDVEIFVMGKRTPIVGWEHVLPGRF